MKQQNKTKTGHVIIKLLICSNFSQNMLSEVKNMKCLLDS